MDKLKLLIGRGCRSDYPLTDPLIEKLQNERDWCNYQIIHLKAANFIESYKDCQNLFNKFQFDLVLIVGDRIETIALGLCAMFNQQKIIHMGSGILNKEHSTFDDMIRHCLTIFSTIQLTEDIKSFKITHDLLELINKDLKNIHIIGNPYEVDDLDFTKVPNTPYDLILMNYETLSQDIENYENYKKAINSIQEKIKIYIGGNPDGRFSSNVINNHKNIFYYDNLPRNQFLGLLSKCTRFITNSSASYYEAPYFLKEEQIIRIGKRNSERSTPKDWSHQDYKSSDKIIEILKNYYNKIKNGSE